MFSLLTLAGTSQAHDLEPLHVDGRYLKNSKGDIVTLHGLMMAVSGFWCEEGAYWINDDYEGGVKYETQWVDSLLALDWKIDYIRILVCNEWITDKATGEYNLGALKENGYFEKLYIPIIEHLNSKGIYAVLYYDGIRPKDDLWRIGDKSQQLAIEFWDYISSHPYVKNNPGIMMELYNEPITIVGSDDRQNNFKDVKNYFQPMVDVIRRNGSNNVVWVPGMNMQSRYAGYATNPIEGENIGYAFHAYFIGNSWDNEIMPVSNMAPCMITEMGWENKNDDEDETSTFGIALKHDIDRTGNVSWNPLVDSQGVYLQLNQPSADGSLTIYNDPEACMVPTWNWYKEYAETKTVPSSQLRAVSVEMEDAPTSAFPGESRAMKLMAKFADGRSWNVAGDAVWTSSDESVLSIDRGNIYVKKAGQSTIHGTYTDSTGQTFEVQFDAVSSMFPLTAAGVNYYHLLWPSPFDEATRTFTGHGSGGWWWADGIDLSAYRYLVIRLDEASFYPMSFSLADAKGNELGIEIREQTEGVIDLQQPGSSIDLSYIKEAQVFTEYPPTAPIKEIFLSNDGVTPAEPPVMRPWGYAADKSMTYGDEVPELTYNIVGTAPSQAPVLSTTATKTSPVGTYEITIAGSDDDVDYQPGTLQVLPAQLTVTASDVVIGAGMDIPTLTLTYEGFRNDDTEATALSEKPTATTTATKDSPCGNYEIIVSGGSAANYDIVRYGGTLTITPNQDTALPIDRTDRVGTSPEDWNASGECSIDYAPAVTTADGRTAQMAERYEETVETVGTVLEQTVTGLENGNYTLVLCANAYYTDSRGFDSDLTEGATDVVCLHANDVTVPMTAHIGTAIQKNNEYTLEVTVTDGTLHISMEKLKAGTNWHTLQIKRLTLLLSFEETYAKTLAEAEELLPQKMSVYAKKDLQQTIAAEHTYANYFRLAEAVKQGRKSVDALAFAARALAVMKDEMLTATNVCTPEAEKKFQQFYQLTKRLYEDDWLTTEKANDFYNPYEGGGGIGYWEIAELLSSVWEIAGVEEPPYGVGWAVVNDNGFVPPSMTYDAPEGSPTLAARTLTATMTGMEPGDYTLSAFVRMRAVDGDVAPKGITLQLCDGEAVPLSGERFRDWNDYLGHYTARGTVGDDGVLTVRFIVAEDNNVSQLAFRDLWQAHDSSLSLQLAEGWNWMSVPLGADGQEALPFLQPIEDKVERMLSQTEELVNDSRYGLVGNLQTLTPQSGYKLKVKADIRQEWTGGACIPQAIPVNLHEGWNWLGCVPAQSMPLSYALRQLTPQEGDHIVARDDFATYTDGQWQGTLETLQPGQGYMYHAGSDVTFRYPNACAAESAAGSRMRIQAAAPTSPWHYDAHAYPDNMTMVAALASDGATEGDARLVVGAFVGDECRGVAKWVDDRLFLTIHGETGQGEDVTLRAYDPLTGEVLAIGETFTFEGQGLGTPKAPVVLHLNGQATLVESPLQQEHKDAFVYTLDGRRLSTSASLKPGLYIVNGQKKIVGKQPK